MKLTIDFSPTEEEQFVQFARREGVEPAALLKRLVKEHIPLTDPSDPVAHVQALLSEWQAADQTPLPTFAANRPDETPMKALFRLWDEEDAALTDEEQKRRANLWDDYQTSLNETRAAQGMRTLF